LGPIPEPIPEGVRPRTRLVHDSGPSKPYVFPREIREYGLKKGECCANKGTDVPYSKKEETQRQYKINGQNKSKYSINHKIHIGLKIELYTINYFDSSLTQR